MATRTARTRGYFLSTILLVTIVQGCGWLDDGARQSARIARAGSDEAFSSGIALSDDAVRVAPSRGEALRARIATLSDDENVREAAYGLGWDVMCDVVTQSLPTSAEDIAGYVASGAAAFGLAFTDEASQAMGEVILDEIDGNESAIREQCAELQP